MTKTAKLGLVLWAHVLGIVLVPGTIASAAENKESGRVDVILWFDTEDYLLPADDDASKIKLPD